MGRTGIEKEMLETFCFKIKENPFIKVQGVYTHFAVADVDKEFTDLQIKKFNEGLETIKKYFSDIKYIHHSASNGILNFENSQTNAVRPGIIMYGYAPYEGAYKKLNLKPIAKLKSRINFIKTLKKGESVSYGRIFIAEKDTRVATVPIGYADGWTRQMQGFKVLVNGEFCEIVGRVCMDQMMIKLDKSYTLGTKVTLIGRDKTNEITTTDVADWRGTINYEVLCLLSDRIKRIYK